MALKSCTKILMFTRRFGLSWFFISRV